MLRKLVAVSFTFAVAISVANAAENTPAQTKMSASEIVSKNIGARGGLQQWRAVQTMTMEGKMGAGGNQRAPVPEPLPGKKKSVIPTDIRPKDEVMLPFTMDLQRPRKERVEILFNGKTALQVFDGSSGWKLRPYLNRLEVEPYSADELKLASMQADLDGYLVDYAAKGTQIESDGMEKVGDHDNFKLKLTMKDGHSVHIWIDAQTYLETKVEGQSRRLDGIEHPVEIYYKDYRAVSGLQIPFLLETHVLPVAKAGKVPGALSGPIPVEKIVIDKVQVNPKLDASLFVKPQVQTASNHNP
jgi:hypothetical protein